MVLRRILKSILVPLRDNAVFFVFLYALGILTMLIDCYVLNFKVQRFNYFSWVFDLYVLCLFLELFPRRVRSYVSWGIAIFTYALSVVNVFCVETFHARIGPEILNVVLETNPRESSEFLDKYVHLDVLLSGVGLVLLLLVAHVLTACYKETVVRWLRSLPFLRFGWMRTAAKTMAVIIIVVCVCMCWSTRLSMCRLMCVSNVAEVDAYVSNRVQNTPFFNLLFAVKMRQMANSGLSVLAERQQSVQVDSCSYRSDNIVLIVGESYIKGHSQLYGYEKPTTPRQLALTQPSDSGLLMPFTDVVSPSNLTSVVFKNAFSLHSIEDKRDWSDFPLMPVLFRKADYQVTFLTNQFVKALDTDIFNISGGLFLNESRLSNAMFSHRNPRSHQFDEGLLDDYDSLRVFAQQHNLIIFHLAGQHIDFYKRSPEQFKKFNAEDYAHRTSLNEEQRQLVADYDNATLYNDYVVAAIVDKFIQSDAVVVYMPDHGEECFDEQPRMGRMPGDNFEPEVLRQEYSIPFWIWCSRSYMERHPELVAQIQAARHRPFMTDDLPHLLLYLAGICCPEYSEERNVIADGFNAERKRLVGGKVDYDAVVGR